MVFLLRIEFPLETNPLSLDTVGGEGDDYEESLIYLSDNKPLVEFGKVARPLLKSFDIKQDVYGAEFDWDLIMEIISSHKILFTPLPRFQVVKRDFSLLLGREVTFEALRKAAFKTENKILRQVDLFDVYEGDKIEKGKKSYALSFTLLDENETLTDHQIDKVMMNLARAFEKEFGARVRGMD